MTIEKKSLIHKTTKRAAVVGGDLNPSNVTSKKMLKPTVASARAVTKRHMGTKISLSYQKIEY